MNKRIRKKQLKRTLCKLLAAYGEYEATRERIFHKTMQGVAESCGTSQEASLAAFRRYMEIASIMASSGPPPRSLTE